MRWYINRNGNNEGPLDEAVILQMIGRGELNQQSYACPEGGQAWQQLSSHPPFAQALAGPAPQVHQAAAAVATEVNAAANAFSQAFAGSPSPQPQQQAFGQPAQQQAFGQPAQQGAFGQPQQQAAFAQPAAQPAFGQPAGQAPIVQAPGAAAPGQGFFEQAKARGEVPSEAAKAAAGQAYLFSAGLAFVGCGFGGLVGAFLGGMLYKEQPKNNFALFHINQALVFQGVCIAANIALGFVFFIIRFVAYMISDILGLIASGLTLINVVLFLAAVLLPLLQMGKAKNGEWSLMPIVGKRVMGLKAPILK